MAASRLRIYFDKIKEVLNKRQELSRMEFIKEYNSVKKKVVQDLAADEGLAADLLLNELKKLLEKFHRQELTDTWEKIDLIATALEIRKDPGIVKIAEEEVAKEGDLDHEYWGEILITFGENEALRNFIFNNPNYHNHYFLEKIIYQLASYDQAGPDLIDNYLNHDSYSVKAAALYYVRKKQLKQFKPLLISRLASEDDDRLVFEIIDILNSWQINEDIIEESINNNPNITEADREKFRSRKQQ